MKCPKCSFEQEDKNSECIGCGVIFDKYLEAKRLRKEKKAFEPKNSVEISGRSNLFKELFFHVEFDVNPFYFGGRVLLFLIILIWGWKFILSPMESNSVGSSVWHLVNLPFHEAGHIFFRPFGRLMTSLGGSLGQLLMPTICLGVFLLATRDPFAGSVSLWWIGENFMDLAPYINDARTRKLMLLGGNTGRNSPYGFHDWEFILNETGMMKHDHTIANISHTIGIILMLTAFAWAGFILFKQFKNLDI